MSEARDCLLNHIPYFKEKRVPYAVVITGSGHHTLGPQKGQARLLPAIETLCEELGMVYQNVVDQQGYKGAVKVFL